MPSLTDRAHPCAARAAELHALWRQNRRHLAADHRARRERSRGRPAHLKIELTNFCNLSCPICPHPQMRREVGYMAPELFRKIIDEAAPTLEFAYLHHLGESLFHGRIGELVRYGRAAGAAMGLSTNATFLTRRKAEALLEAGLDFLVISLDAATGEAYARQRVGGDFETTLGNVQGFFELRDRLRAPTAAVLQIVVTDDNRGEVEAFARRWRGRGERVMIKEARDWAGQVPLRIAGRRDAPPAAPEPPAAQEPCRMPWTELTVLWDGTVVPCANVFERQNVLGDLRRQSLGEIWDGAAMAALRAAHRQGRLAEVPVCATCPRHPLEPEAFVALDQLTQRLRHYCGEGGDDADYERSLTPRPGLS